MLEIRDLSIEYEYPLIEKSNLFLYAGRMISLVGPSGCGKTSILEAIASINRKYIRSYIYQGKDLISSDSMHMERFKYQHIFYIKQDYAYIDSLTCYNHLMLLQPGYQKKDILDVLAMVSLEIDENIYPENLSTGQKQRFYLALAIASGADIILCDELTASLDPLNKDKILNLLDYLAKNQNKTILFATHDQEVVNRCDSVYEIKEHHVIEVKKSKEDNHQETILLRKEPTFFHMVRCQLSRMKHKLGSFQLYCLFTIMIVAACGLGIIFGSQETMNNQHIYALLENNQYYLTNKYVPDQKSGYSEYNPPFEDTFIEQLKHVDAINTLYPYYQLPMNKKYLNHDAQFVDHLSKNYTIKINNIEKKYDEDSPQFYTFPYYQEDYMYEKCQGETYDADGVYLSFDAAKNLGIDSLDEPMTIEYTVLIPIDSEDNDSISFADSNGTVSVGTGLKNDLYKECIITLPISGILDMAHVSYGGASNIYVPFDYLNSIFDKESPKYRHNTYTAYVNDNFDSEQFIESMSQYNSHLDVFNLRSHFTEIDYSILNTEKMIMIADAILFITAIILSFVYGLYLRKANQQLDVVLKGYGYSYKLRKKYHKATLVGLIGIIVIGTFIISNIVYYLLTASYVIYRYYNYQYLYFIMLIVILGLSMLLPWISYLPTLLKKEDHDD